MAFCFQNAIHFFLVMIDTHSHIYTEEFDKDRDAVVRRAKEAGVTQIVLPNINKNSLLSLLHLESSDPEYFHAAIGLHPTELTEEDPCKQLLFVEKELERRPYCAIGEVGLDFYWNKHNAALQIEIFERQLQWALDRDLPVLIHARKATRKAVECVSKIGKGRLSGIFHSFEGSLDEAKAILGLGNFLFGINGIVTFKTSRLCDVLPKIPLEKIVLETDSPYLAPIPFRGKRNESSYISCVASKLADIYQLSQKEIAKKTEENSLQLLKTLSLPRE